MTPAYISWFFYAFSLLVWGYLSYQDLKGYKKWKARNSAIDAILKKETPSKEDLFEIARLALLGHAMTGGLLMRLVMHTVTILILLTVVVL